MCRSLNISLVRDTLRHQAPVTKDAPLHRRKRLGPVTRSMRKAWGKRQSMVLARAQDRAPWLVAESLHTSPVVTLPSGMVRYRRLDETRRYDALICMTEIASSRREEEKAASCAFLSCLSHSGVRRESPDYSADIHPELGHFSHPALRSLRPWTSCGIHLACHHLLNLNLGFYSRACWQIGIRGSRSLTLIIFSAVRDQAKSTPCEQDDEE